MSEKPLVSIGIALYRADFLERLFHTLANQTYSNIEYIISIDSPDNNKIQKMVKSFKESANKVKVYNHRPSLGSWENAHFVYQEATGDYFMRLDDDDSLKNNTHIESLVYKLNEGYDYAFTNVDVEKWHNGKCISTRQNTMKCYENCASNYDYANASLYETAMIFYAMFKVEHLRRMYHYLHERGDTLFFGEGVFVHGVTSQLKGCYLPEEIFIYRIHDDNVSNTYVAKELAYDYKQYLKSSLRLFMLDTEFTLIQKRRLLTKFVLKTTPVLVRYYLSWMKNSLLHTFSRAQIKTNSM